MTPSRPPTPTATQGTTSCFGDCNGSGDVAVNELVTMVNIALDRAGLETCPSGDTDGSGTILVNELVTAVNYALRGCP